MTDRVIQQKILRLQAGGRPRVLDLFAGCGGLSLGFDAAGFEISAAIEIDPIAAASTGRNFHDGEPAHSISRDITAIKPAQFVKELNLGATCEAFDVIIGGPPCQAFARVGRSKLREIDAHPEAFRHDARAKLYAPFLSYVKACRPLAILMENVPDILNFGGHNIPEEICEVLNGVGYVCAYTLLNAAFYGVPQMRERMFLIAYHEDISDSVTFPAPTHWVSLPPGYKNSRQVALKFLSRCNIFGEANSYVSAPEASEDLHPAITAEEAIGDLPAIKARELLRKGKLKGGARRFNQLIPYDAKRAISEYGRLMKDWPGFEAHEGIYDHLIRYLPRDYELFAQMKQGDQYPEAHICALGMFEKRRSKLAEEGVCISPGSKEYKTLKKAIVPPYDVGKFPNKWRKIWRKRPVRTVMAHLGKDGYSHIHYDSKQARTISVREAARLQSFPDGFTFEGAMNQAFHQIGNAVPPLMAKTIAIEMMERIRASVKVIDSVWLQEGSKASPSRFEQRLQIVNPAIDDHTDSNPGNGTTSDILTPEQRRLVMSRIKGKDTEPEMLIRRGLHARGLRYRLHAKDVAGRPDMVFPNYQVVVFTHGCFWHGHGCSMFKWPRTRAEFWRKKIGRNRERDSKILNDLNSSRWRVLVIWECALRGKYSGPLVDVLDRAEKFIREGNEKLVEIEGNKRVRRKARKSAIAPSQVGLDNGFLRSQRDR